jgi:hypothetical protein
MITARHHRSVMIVDVRRDLEWADSHIDGAPSTCPCMSFPAAWPRYRTGSCECITGPGTAP